jgi:hypothetical protein
MPMYARAPPVRATSTTSPGASVKVQLPSVATPFTVIAGSHPTTLT